MKRCLACDTRFVAADWVCPHCGRAPSTMSGLLAFAPELARGNGTDAEYRLDALEAAERTHFWFRNRAELIVWAIRRHFPGATSMLEAGCGTGAVAGAISSALPPIRVAAGELLLSGLERARARFPSVEFVQMDALNIPFASEFDLVGAFDVIEHIDDDVRALEEMRDACRPGGGILITVPQHPSLWSAVDDFSHHRRRYTRRELAAKLERAGLTVIWMTSFASAVVPVMFASRRVPQTFNPERELRIAPAANLVLSAVSRCERAVIAAGLSLPIGGSLLAIATRPS